MGNKQRIFVNAYRNFRGCILVGYVEIFELVRAVARGMIWVVENGGERWEREGD
jgi:hypothetical protein